MTGTLSPVPEYTNIILITHSPLQRALRPLTLGVRITEVHLALTQEAQGQHLYPQPKQQRGENFGKRKLEKIDISRNRLWRLL